MIFFVNAIASFLAIMGSPSCNFDESLDETISRPSIEWRSLAGVLLERGYKEKD